MPTKNKSSLLTLPIELIHRIFDHIDTETIIFAIRRVCKQLYSIVNIYDRYELDFRYMFRSDLSLIAHIINPENVTSLILSNAIHTSDQIDLFISQFHIEQFIRLHSLTLINVEKELDQFQKHIMQCPLRKFSIVLPFDDIMNLQTLLSSIISNSHLRELEFTASSWLLDEIQWPIECQLEHLTIFHHCSWDTIKLVLSHLHHLRTLVMKDVKLYDLHKTSIMNSDMTQFNCLSSLSLNSSEFKFDNVEVLLSFFPRLEHLQLINHEDYSDPLFFNGTRLENLIETKLCLLKKFDFWFSNYAQHDSDEITVETVIATFRTLFWLEDKHWIVKCDSEYKENLELFYLYSIPICRDDFDYSSQQSKIRCSALNTTDKNRIITVNANQLSVDLSQMMIQNIQRKTNLRMNYLFQNVTELKLIINEKWPIGSIKQLSRILHMSKLKKLCLNFNSECNFIVNLTVEMDTLLNRATNLRSIEINCSGLVKTMSKILNAICLKLPDHIRHLKTDIENVNDGKEILQCAEHLSIITFRPRKRSCFNDEIIQLISKMHRDVQYKLQPDMVDERIDPEDDCTIHLWFGKNMNRQSNTLANNKSRKRSHKCLQS
ncbi:unnamed protein product [Rotaria sp. Silwood1]|nr:unnamed protein product [Rotaria sp. Silwood1]